MLIDGIRIMVGGMGVVFLILFFLITSISISAKIIARFQTADNTKVIPQNNKNHIAAVIAAAIAKFKKDKAK